jgi:hypothetical protein
LTLNRLGPQLTGTSLSLSLSISLSLSLSLIQPTCLVWFNWFELWDSTPGDTILECIYGDRTGGSVT